MSTKTRITRVCDACGETTDEIRFDYEIAPHWARVEVTYGAARSGAKHRDRAVDLCGMCVRSIRPLNDAIDALVKKPIAVPA